MLSSIDFVCSITNICLNKTVVQIPVDDLRKGTPLLLICLHTSRYIHNRKVSKPQWSQILHEIVLKILHLPIGLHFHSIHD